MSQKSSYTLDHVHILVADRELSAKWYCDLFGFEITECTQDPYGPLSISGDGGATGLALFTSRVSSDSNRVVAFRVTADEFVAFGARLLDQEVRGGSGARVCPEDAKDHGDVLSFYINDPDCNPIEIMTRELEPARVGLRRLSVESRLEL
ncbi:MAG: catechol 2,3-dioxygenase-like lactoylglutathione lyase family enzyme [Candidatus Paceibacteria bacterium]|jgi:catechol 2,3-dioxygenase-like lactoylglutathione lyase family enzyme